MKVEEHNYEQEIVAATVVFVGKGYILVEFIINNEYMTSLCKASFENVLSIPELDKGDRVKITFSGIIKESCPGIMYDVTDVVKIE